MAASWEPLIVDNLRKIWKTEFLPSIKREISNKQKTKIVKMNCLITNLSKRLHSMESSQQMISDKYDSILESLQSTKKQINDLSNWCTAQDNKINYINAEVVIDSMEQYSRRDCFVFLPNPNIAFGFPSKANTRTGPTHRCNSRQAGHFDRPPIAW